MRGRGVKKESRDGLARSAVAFPQELTARHGIGGSRKRRQVIPRRKVLDTQVIEHTSCQIKHACFACIAFEYQVIIHIHTTDYTSSTAFPAAMRTQVER